MDRDSSNQYALVSLERAIAILLTFSYRQPELSFTEICDLNALKKASAKRLLSTLEQQGLVRRNEDGKYTLGATLVELGALASDQLTLPKVGRSEVKWLCNQTGETVILVEWTGSEQSYVLKAEGHGAVRVASHVETRRAVYYGLGRTILAFLPPHEVDALLPETLPPYTDRSITSKEMFLKELDAIRQRGYAIDNRESLPGAIGVGAPIFKRGARVCGFIGVLAPAIDEAHEQIDRVARLASEAASRISTALGHHE